MRDKRKLPALLIIATIAFGAVAAIVFVPLLLCWFIVVGAFLFVEDLWLRAAARRRLARARR